MESLLPSAYSNDPAGEPELHWCRRVGMCLIQRKHTMEDTHIQDELHEKTKILSKRDVYFVHVWVGERKILFADPWKNESATHHPERSRHTAQHKNFSLLGIAKGGTENIFSINWGPEIE